MGLCVVFPNGDNLNVRYRIDQNNPDKWSGLVGTTFGLKSGICVLSVLELVGQYLRHYSQAALE